MDCPSKAMSSFERMRIFGQHRPLCHPRVQGPSLPGAALDALLAAPGCARRRARRPADTGWAHTLCAAAASGDLVQGASAGHQPGRGLLATGCLARQAYAWSHSTYRRVGEALQVSETTIYRWVSAWGQDLWPRGCSQPMTVPPVALAVSGSLWYDRLSCYRQVGTS